MTYNFYWKWQCKIQHGLLISTENSYFLRHEHNGRTVQETILPDIHWEGKTLQSIITWYISLAHYNSYKNNITWPWVTLAQPHITVLHHTGIITYFWTKWCTLEVVLSRSKWDKHSTALIQLYFFQSLNKLTELWQGFTDVDMLPSQKEVSTAVHACSYILIK